MLKKGLIALLVLACLASFVGCGTTMSYEFGPVSGGPTISDTVNGNGNAVVQKGEYVYYINSLEVVGAKNVLGSSYAGAIMRANVDGSNAVAIFPKVVTNTSNTGLTIIGDRIYFTSPSDMIDSKGNVQSYYLDIMSVKLDGTDAKKHITLGSTEVRVAFIDDGDDYAVYTQNGILYKVNLSQEDSEKEEVMTGHTSMVIDGNDIYYTKPVNETSTEASLYIRSLNGDTKDASLVTCSATETLTLVGVKDGNVYYTLADSVVSLESSLYCFNIDTMSAKKVSAFPATQAVAYKDGFVYTAEGVGTVLSIGGTYTQLTSASVSIVDVIDGKLIYQSVESEKGKLYSLDLDKVAAGETPQAIQLMEYVTKVTEEVKDEETDETTSKEVEKTVYDEFISKYFAEAIVYGDTVYYYSSTKASQQLVAYNMETKTFTVMTTTMK